MYCLMSVFSFALSCDYPAAIADMCGLMSVSCLIPTLVAESLYPPEQDIFVHFSVIMVHTTDNRTGQTRVQCPFCSMHDSYCAEQLFSSEIHLQCIFCGLAVHLSSVALSDFGASISC